MWKSIERKFLPKQKKIRSKTQPSRFKAPYRLNRKCVWSRILSCCVPFVNVCLLCSQALSQAPLLCRLLLLLCVFTLNAQCRHNPMMTTTTMMMMIVCAVAAITTHYYQRREFEKRMQIDQDIQCKQCCCQSVWYFSCMFRIVWKTSSLVKFYLRSPVVEMFICLVDVFALVVFRCVYCFLFFASHSD